MDTFLFPLLDVAIVNAITVIPLALAAWLAGRTLRHPALTHALWVLVLAKLVTPPLFQLPYSIESLASRPAATADDFGPSTLVPASSSRPPNRDRSKLWLRLARNLFQHRQSQSQRRRSRRTVCRRCKGPPSPLLCSAGSGDNSRTRPPRSRIPRCAAASCLSGWLGR